jgi:hypothetical protein
MNSFDHLENSVRPKLANVRNPGVKDEQEENDKGDQDTNFEDESKMKAQREEDQFEVPRDPGVSDIEWKKLQQARLLEEKRLQEIKDEKERRKELERLKKIQEKLNHMGICPNGFQWIHQNNGWICAGGSHFVSNFVLK